MEERAQVEADGGFHGAKSVDLGQALLTHGCARLGSLRVPCGGEIHGQLWGAGASLAEYFFTDDGKKLVDWTVTGSDVDVLEVGSGTGLLGLSIAGLPQPSHCTDPLDSWNIHGLKM